MNELRVSVPAFLQLWSSKPVCGRRGMFGEKRDAILSPRDEGEISPEVMRRIERDLRHTCATLLLQQGTHPTLVQHLLGKASVCITLDRYSHRLPSMGDQTARTMERALG